MESETVREIQTEEDRRGLDNKGRRRTTSGSGSDEVETKENVVGMVADSSMNGVDNGVFNDPREVAKSLVEKVGEVESVRTTHSGMELREMFPTRECEEERCQWRSPSSV